MSSAPAGTPDFPPPQVFTRATYKATYQDPGDDWGREGGVLRSDDMGANLEIVSRGLRNPWDIAFDSGFNWLGTDNDQSDGDRVFMPFFGAHFGWGHVWSNHWTGADHAPTAPISGPVFDGSGTGILYYDAPQMPPAFRGVWFFNDWLRKTTFVYRPRWDGALIQPEGGRWQSFASGGGAGRAVANYGARDSGVPPVATALFQPVDIVAGPDGALYISGWGEEYGAVWKDGQQANEGRIFRISWPAAPATNWDTPKRGKPIAQWTFEELFDDLGSAAAGLVRRRAGRAGTARSGSQRRTHGAAPRQGTAAGPGDVGPVGARPDRADGPHHRRVVCRHRPAPFAERQHPGDPDRGPPHPGAPLNRPTAGLRRCGAAGRRAAAFVLPPCRPSLRRASASSSRSCAISRRERTIA